jgi:hypothetical protein
VVVKTCSLCLQIDWINNYDNPSDVQVKSLNVLGDDIYITGSFAGNFPLAGRTLSSAEGINNLFILKLDIEGTSKWSRQTLMNSTGSSATVYNAVRDQFGNLYFGGSYTSDTLFIESSSSTVNKSVSTFGGEDMFLIKYNPEGNMKFIKDFGHTGSDRLRNLDFKNDILYITGFYTEFLVFGSDTLISEDMTEWEFFLGALDMEGNPLLIKGIETYSASNQRDMGISVSVNNNIQAHTLGIFRSDSIHFDNEGYAKQGVQDMFVAIYQPEFTATFTEVVHPPCYGSSEGRLKVVGYFGLPPYSYAWSHNPSLDTSLAQNLSAGSYSVTITDQRDSSAIANVTLTEPAQLEINKTVSNVSCFNDSDGSIDITVTGGTPAYTYAWTGTGSGASGSAEDQSGISAGLFFLTVTDDKGCVLLDTSEVIQADRITFANVSVSEVSSEGAADGAISAEATGGTPAYSYAWEGEAPLVFSSAADTTINSLAGGLYYLTITDSKSCERDTSFVVNEPGVLIAFIDSIQNITCKGDSNGLLSVIPLNYDTAGTLAYHWEGPDGFTADTNIIGNLASGMYQVTVTDGSGTAYASATIEEAAANLNLFSSRTHVKCHGNHTGAIDLTVFGGVSPYKYLWSNSATTEDISGLEAGLYSVTVTDQHGCEGFRTNIVLGQPDAALTASISIEAIPSCYGSLDGALRVTASGGTGSKTYLWNDPASQSSSVASGLEGSKNYSVTVTDENNCAEIRSYELPQPEELEISSVEKTNVSDLLANDGSITVISSGGTSPISYTLQPDNTANHTGIFDDLSAGKYQVEVTDANTCANLKTDTIMLSYLQVVDTLIGMPLCYGDSNGSIQITVDGNAGPFTYAWEDLTGNGTDDANSAYQSGLTAGTYRVTITDDAESSTIEEYTVGQTDSLVIVDVQAVDVSAPSASDGSISVEMSGGTLPLTFILNTDLDTNETGEFTNLSEGDYLVSVSDANECVTLETDTITISSTSSINALLEDNELLIYPVPARDQLVLEISATHNEQIRYTIINMNGQSVQSGTISLYAGTNNSTLDVSKLATGSYLLNLLSGEESKTIQIQIVR